MGTLKIVLTVLLVIVGLIVSAIVLMQEGKSSGLTGTIAGSGADSFYNKNKGRTLEGKLEKSTKFLVAAFFILALLLNVM